MCADGVCRACVLCAVWCGLCVSTVLRQLAQEGSAEFVGYQNSILMQLLSGKGGLCAVLVFVPLYATV